MADRDDFEADDAASTDRQPQAGSPPPEAPEPPVSEPTPAAPASESTGSAPVSEPNPKRLTARNAMVVGARSAAAVIGVAVAAVVIIGATVITGPGHRVTPPAASVNPVPAAQQRVCPGPLLRLGDDSGQAASIASSIGRPSVSFQAVPGAPLAGDLSSTENPAGVPPVLLTLPPSEVDPGAAPALAGSQSEAIDAGDIVGFAAAECTEASGDTWLVGGATDVGRTTLLTISNPSTVMATVDLGIYGSGGPVTAPGAEGIIVPPGSQRIFSLASFAPGLASPVVRVESRGGQVVANLQQSIVRTLAPGGVSIVGRSSAPATTATIPGLVLSGAEELAAARSQPGYEDLETVLRLFLPGEEDGSATITVTPEEGSESVQEETPAPEDETVPDAPAPEEETAPEQEPDPVLGAEETSFEFGLTAGRVSEVPLAGLRNGRYTVTIESDVPIVAGARVSIVAADGRTDFAWLAAAEPLRASTLVSVAPGPSPVLHLANPGDEDATVTIVSSSGETELAVPAGAGASTPVGTDLDIALTGAEGLLATVNYLGDGQLAAFTVTTPGPASRAITVYR